jgi:hypothetical protein
MAEINWQNSAARHAAYGPSRPNFTFASPACRTCNDTGAVVSADHDGESAYDSACPEPGCTTPYPVAAYFTDTGEAPY